jgi:hypothetical protein
MVSPNLESIRFKILLVGWNPIGIGIGIELLRGQLIKIGFSRKQILRSFQMRLFDQKLIGIELSDL